MARLSDTELVGILYRATGLITPVLDVLEHSDPFTHNERLHADGDDDGVIDADHEESFSAKAVNAAADSLAWVTNAATAPGSPRWEKLSVSERSDWWVKRVGALTTILVAYPGVFGAAADRLPIQDVLGFTQQAFVLCAVARVHGVTDRHRQVDLLAEVLCGRTVDTGTLLAKTPVETVDADPAAVESEQPAARSWSARDVVQRVWATAKVLRAVIGETKRRPTPSKVWRTLSAVPVVGAAADYVGERSALRRAAGSATDWLERAPVRS